MKYLFLFFVCCNWVFGQSDIRSVQLFNPQTNDETAVIGFNEQLILRFDDLSNSSQIYRYTLKHYNRNWEDDGLFFTEYANGSLNGLLDNFQYSFNTYQKYTHYELSFPNEKIQPKISGNFALVVYKDSPERPIFIRKFCVVEQNVTLGLKMTRFSDARNPALNQRVEVVATGSGNQLTSNANSMTLSVIQNNNWNLGVYNVRPGSSAGNQILFQQLQLVFPGNNEFYYFDNKIIEQPLDMVEKAENIDGVNYTHLFPVWAYPHNYQYQPDVNGAFYFRRNDLGIEREAGREADYSWVSFYLDSEKIDKNIYVLGQFNDYAANEKSQMKYDESRKQYVAKMYLKQGFYSYLVATGSENGALNYGEINGNFWQTENLYQGFLYYTPFGRNYDGLLGYGELRASFVQ